MGRRRRRSLNLVPNSSEGGISYSRDVRAHQALISAIMMAGFNLERKLLQLEGEREGCSVPSNEWPDSEGLVECCDVRPLVPRGLRGRVFHVDFHATWAYLRQNLTHGPWYAVSDEQRPMQCRIMDPLRRKLGKNSVQVVSCCMGLGASAFPYRECRTLRIKQGQTRNLSVQSG